jgi:hypothetical protein
MGIRGGSRFQWRPVFIATLLALVVMARHVDRAIAEPLVPGSASAADSSGASAADSVATQAIDSTSAPAAPSSDTPTTADLAPTSDVPWNPPEVIHDHEAWENAVNAPGRILAIPFSLIGFGAGIGLIFVEENNVVPRVAAQVGVLQKYGLAIGPASLGDRTGWGGLLGFSPTFYRRIVMTMSGSTGGYNRFQFVCTFPFATLEYQNDWRSRDLFFGVGLQSPLDQGSNFASQSEIARLTLRLPFAPGAERRVHEILNDPADATVTPVSRHPDLRAWIGPRSVVLLNGRENTSKHRPIEDRFPTQSAEFLGERVEHLTYGGVVGLDRRSGRPHWWRGWRALTRAERFDKSIEALAFHDAHTPEVQFTRLTYEGELGWSFWRDPRTFRLYGRVVDQHIPTNPNGIFLIPDLSVLGGREGLNGYESGRFRDSDLVMTRFSYIFPVARYLEMDIHHERGGVFPAVESARIDKLKQSTGVALRVRSVRAPLGWIGVDWGPEKIRFGFSIGGVE